VGEHQVSDMVLLDMTWTELDVLVDRVEHHPAATRALDEQLLAELPEADPDAPILVIPSVPRSQAA
jgi:hypothetical protein